MRSAIMGIFILLSQMLAAQNVILNKVEKTGNFEDQFFYRINPDSVQSVYLGELEVQGYSENDEKTFDLIYKKAKSIGANAFSFKPFQSIDGENQKLDPHHYALNLYEVKKTDVKANPDQLYLFSAAEKVQQFRINTSKKQLPSRSYYIQKMNMGEIYTISTGRLLGSTVRLQYNSTEGAQYFKVSSFRVKSNGYVEAGINIKSGDIIKLERSYGDFLTMLYTQIKD